MSKVLITGAGGFCGQHLVRYLCAQGLDVWTMGTRSSSEAQHHRITEITSNPAITAVLKAVRPNYIFHFAGVANAPDAATFYQVNAAYAAALLQALEQSGLAHDCPTMLVGTSAEYGAVTPEQTPISEATTAVPYNHYGISKLAQTQMGLAASRTGRPLIMVRPFNIIGPGMPPHLSVQSFAAQIINISRKQHEPVIEVGNLASTRDFIDVDHAVAMYWKLIQNPEAFGQVVNVCSGTGTVMSDLLQALIDVAEVDITVKVDPQRLKALDVPVHFGCTRKLVRLVGAIPEFDRRRTLQRILEGLLSASSHGQTSAS